MFNMLLPANKEKSASPRVILFQKRDILRLLFTSCRGVSAKKRAYFYTCTYAYVTLRSKETCVNTSMIAQFSIEYRK